MKVKGPIHCVESSSILGWYVIEKVHHSDKSGVLKLRDKVFKNRKFGVYWMSSRVGIFYDVEGSAEEMRELAEAIYACGSYSAKRCAVKVEGNKVYLWSPRNACGYDEYLSIKDVRAEVDYGRALALANQIYDMLA